MMDLAFDVDHDTWRVEPHPATTTAMISPIFTIMKEENFGRRRLTAIDRSQYCLSPHFLRYQEMLPSTSSWAKKRPRGSESGLSFCSCEAGPSKNQKTHPQHPLQQHSHAPDEQCAVCMYTGVATCTGLSLYFIKIATEETTLPKNRRFLYLCSAGWAVAGAYRWYLG